MKRTGQQQGPGDEGAAAAEGGLMTSSAALQQQLEQLESLARSAAQLADAVGLHTAEFSEQQQIVDGIFGCLEELRSLREIIPSSHAASPTGQTSTSPTTSSSAYGLATQAGDSDVTVSGTTADFSSPTRSLRPSASSRCRSELHRLEALVAGLREHISGHAR